MKHRHPARHARRSNPFDVRSVLLFASLTLGTAGAFATGTTVGPSVAGASAAVSSADSRTADEGDRDASSRKSTTKSRVTIPTLR